MTIKEMSVDELVDALADKLQSRFHIHERPVKDCYTVREAAKILGKSREAVYHQIRHGQIQVEKGTNKLMIPKNEVQRLINDRV